MDYGWIYPTAFAIVAAILGEFNRRNQRKVIEGQVVIHDLVNSNLTLVKQARDAAETLSAALSLQITQRDATIEELRHQVMRLTLNPPQK